MRIFIKRKINSLPFFDDWVEIIAEFLSPLRLFRKSNHLFLDRNSKINSHIPKLMIKTTPPMIIQCPQELGEGFEAKKANPMIKAPKRMLSDKRVDSRSSLLMI
jgi:hypothetical protein